MGPVVPRYAAAADCLASLLLLMGERMANRRNAFNLSATIREYQKAHRGASASDALEAVRKDHPGQKINEGTFKATFYKLAGTARQRQGF
jgi:hypothetical protein